MKNRKVPLTTKNIFAMIIFILLSVGFTFLYFGNGIFDEAKPVEKTIERIHIKKGLYLYPRYEVVVEGEEQSNDITKEQFESHDFGDTISGYETSYGDFRTTLDKRYENTIGLVILIVLYWSTIFFGAGLLQNARFIAKDDKRVNVVEKITMTFLYMILGLFIVVGTVFAALTINNLFHKVNTSNQTVVEGIVLTGDYNRSGTGRHMHTEYELFIYYLDNQANEYITRKAVTRQTYASYEQEEPIEIAYRNSNPADIFVVTKDSKEVIGAFTHIFAIMIGLYFVLLFFIVRKFVKKRRESNEEDL